MFGVQVNRQRLNHKIRSGRNLQHVLLLYRATSQQHRIPHRGGERCATPFCIHCQVGGSTSRIARPLGLIHPSVRRWMAGPSRLCMRVREREKGERGEGWVGREPAPNGQRFSLPSSTREAWHHRPPRWYTNHFHAGELASTLSQTGRSSVVRAGPPNPRQNTPPTRVGIFVACTAGDERPL